MNKVYEIFKKNVTYVEYARSGIIYTTDNLEELNELTNCGWNYNSNYKGFRIIPPEETIVDITNYSKAFQYGNPVFNLAYYDFIKEKIDNNLFDNFINTVIQKNAFSYKNFEYLISTGPILDTEVRIAGSDLRIKKLKMNMVQEFINSPEYREYIDISKNQLGNFKKYKVYNKKFSELGIRERQFYIDIKEKLSVIKNLNPYNSKINEISNMEELIKENKIDIMLFLPYGCFKYLSSFTNENNIDKIMFWEFHSEDLKNSTFKLYNKDINGKNILIIDNIYSGKTLKKVKKQIIELGGNPIVLGMNPKNINNIVITNYTIILNKLYNSQKLDISDNNFFRNKYLEILGGEYSDKS